MKFLSLSFVLLLSTGISATHAAASNPVQPKSISGTGGIVTRNFTGIWDQPLNESQGTVIQLVGNGAGGLDAVVYWFIYDDNATPYWYVGQGPVSGNTINLEIYEVTGPTFLSPSNPDDRNLNVWGTGEIVFDDCNNGLFNAQRSISGTGGFQIPIQKLASVANTSCSGGVSDGVNPGDGLVDIRSFFQPSSAAPGASGKAEYEISGGRVDFKVEIEDLPVGNYTVRVGGEDQGIIEVSTTTQGSQGEIEYRSPVEPGKVLLTFDPRNQPIDILNASSQLVLSQTFPNQNSTGGGNPGLPGGDDLEIELPLANTGVYPQGDAEAKFEQRPDRTEFSVELEDIPVGNYPLFVGGAQKAVISVASLPGGTEGEIEFRNPVEAGKVLLDFDPRGQLIEVFEGSTLLFSSDFTNIGPGNPPTGTGQFEVTFALVNSGVDPAARGEVKYESQGSEQDLDVEIEDLSQDGSYQLEINGSVIGSILVDDGEGELKFSDPQDGDDLPLTFDPFNASYRVIRDGTVYFTLTTSG